MRTTVTLDDDTEAMIRRLMAEKGISFKQALNDAIRDGATRSQRPAFRTRTHDFGRSSVDLDKALQLAGQLEDEELMRRMRSGQ